ncbi:hypothetical protein [Duganella vulcania]|uniref:Uncharacterized protein n=1 Tax=Duganella vulcania TaxID=2692166 RepID=A0A845GGX5_9BURK|nr:hypothetical protein [Duganella vulcania]MYM92770.1 hypothetical protein [Duganella vulcania]
MKDRIELAIPVPPMFERAMWYAGDATLVGFYWDCIFDDCVMVDGHSDQIASRNSWSVFCEHPKIAPTLESFAFGNRDYHARNILILDRQKRRFFVMEHDEGEAMIRELAPRHYARSELMRGTATQLTVAARDGKHVLDRPLISKDLAAEIIHSSSGLEKAMVAWLDAGSQPSSAWHS